MSLFSNLTLWVVGLLPKVWLYRGAGSFLTNSIFKQITVFPSYYCWHCCCKDIWIVSSSPLRRNSQKQNVGVFINLVYNEEVKADKNGARHQTWQPNPKERSKTEIEREPVQTLMVSLLLNHYIMQSTLTLWCYTKIKRSSTASLSKSINT